MRPEQIIERADEQQKRTQKEIFHLVRTLENFADHPGECHEDDLLHLLEPYLLLKGSGDDINRFLKILMDDTDPRQPDYAFVVEIMEYYNLAVAMPELKEIEEPAWL